MVEDILTHNTALGEYLSSKTIKVGGKLGRPRKYPFIENKPRPDVRVRFTDVVKDTVEFLLERRQYNGLEAYQHLESLHPGKYYHP